MKQLLSTSENSILVAYGYFAFLLVWNEIGEDIQVYQLSSITSNESEIQSVAMKKEADNCFKCAVSRQDKTIDIYMVELTGEGERNSVNRNFEPIITHKSSKRCGSMLFASVEDTSHDGKENNSTDSSTKSLDILVTGDISGDVTAFPISTSQQGKSRLLLGHTVSILTSIKLVHGRLFSADRDEKIRVSTFPQTYQTEGYFLGHDAYITDIDVSKDGSLCISVSGDSTMRLWNCATFQQMKVVDLSDENKNEVAHLPIKVTMNDGGTVAVIYDECNFIDIFNHALNKVQRIILPAIPLAISFDPKDRLVVALTDPSFIMFHHQVSGDLFEAIESKATSSAIQKISQSVHGVSISKTILEKDENGRNSLMKLVDEKDDDAEMPWNRVERIEKQKERARRRKRRKLEEVLVEPKD